MTITYEIYHHNNLIGTTSEYLDYKQQITIKGKKYLVVSKYKNSILDFVNSLPDRAYVISIDRYDYKGNKLTTGDIVELEGYFYKIGDLCSEFDKEYVTYLNLDSTESETNYASYCTKLTYEHYEELKSDYLTFLSRLEEVYKLVQIETWEEWESLSLQGKVDLFNNK
jgi:hypothetical protein